MGKPKKPLTVGDNLDVPAYKEMLVKCIDLLCGIIISILLKPITKGGISIFYQAQANIRNSSLDLRWSVHR